MKPDRYMRVFLGSSQPQRPLTELNRIFLPYTGSGGNQSRLGLGVAQKIIRQHQGWLEVVNGGAPQADFAVVLPVVQN